MSAHLYRGAASAESFAVAVYLAFGLCAAASGVASWGTGYFPLSVVAALVCGRMAGSHWRERCELIETAKQIEENEQA